MTGHNPNTQALSDVGVSIWLDDLSRERLTSGSLAELVATHNVVGVTTNPTIFAGAISSGSGYEEALDAAKAAGADAVATVTELTCRDVADACDVLAPVHRKTDGRDGWVSIEVDPRFADDPAATVEQARELRQRIGRDNVMIKIPATPAGLEAIAAVLAEGISVNVTLIFALERYREVINAYLTGLERARAAGRDLSRIHSVASFFVSRLDTEVSARLDAAETAETADARLRGAAGIANARLAYGVFQEGFDSERARMLLDAGANLQRPLWASTGVKDPELPDTCYVTELAAPDVVNTMPEKTLAALADHGAVTGDTVTGRLSEAHAVLDAIHRAGIDYAEVTQKLETEGVAKFVDSWNELLDTVTARLAP